MTPAHFLIGDRFADVAALPRGQQYPYQRRWFKLQDLLDHFWRRFVAEILPQFHHMNKWTREKPTFEVGDIVLILEKDDRGHWPLGRIMEIQRTERDGRVRKVLVKSNGQTYARSAHGLLLLDSLLEEQRMKTAYEKRPQE